MSMISLVYQPFALLALRRLFTNFDEKFKRAGGRIKPWLYNGVWSGITVGYPTSSYLFGNGLPKHPNLPFASKAPSTLNTRDTVDTFSSTDGLNQHFTGGFNHPPIGPTSNDGYLDTIWMTRANLEGFLRGEVVSACSNVEIITGSVASMIMDESEKDRIRGITYHAKGENGISTLDAALVVGMYRLLDSTSLSQVLGDADTCWYSEDCTGHSKKGARWLEERGYGKIPEVTYDPQLRYTSGQYTD
jgi:hypothetical protein